MATILHRLTRSLSPTVVGELAKQAGLAPTLAARGMAIVGPVITLALADKASGPSGPSAVFQMLPVDGPTALLGELAFVARRSKAQAAMLASVLGTGASAVGEALGRSLGFRASSLIRVSIPVVLRQIGMIVREEQLDAAGVAAMLSREAAEFRAATGDDACLVRDALDAGRHAADVIARYSREEWESVRLAPVAAAHVVMIADRSAPMGAMKEISAATQAVDDARRNAPPTSVVTLAFEADFTIDELTRFTRSRTHADALIAVRDALDTISRMNPSDAPRFRRLVEDVAARVAIAANDGGMFERDPMLASAPKRAAINELWAMIDDA